MRHPIRRGPEGLNLERGAADARERLLARTPDPKSWRATGTFLRRIRLLLTTIVGALVMGSGVAWASTVYCTVGAASCIGTDEDDSIGGNNAPNEIRALTG